MLRESLATSRSWQPPARIIHGRRPSATTALAFRTIPLTISDPFVQLRATAGESHSGSGLGLALVKSLAGLHGGTMRIESAIALNTIVTVEIPAPHTASLAA